MAVLQVITLTLLVALAKADYPAAQKGGQQNSIQYAGPIVYSNEKPPVIHFPPPPSDGFGGSYKSSGGGYSGKTPSIKYVPLPHHELPVLIYTSDKNPPVHVVHTPKPQVKKPILAKAPTPTYGAPKAPSKGYGAPRPPTKGRPTKGGLFSKGRPSPQKGYRAPQPQKGYGPPPKAPSKPVISKGYGAPPPQKGYGPPPKAPPKPVIPKGYGAPPPQKGYGAPPPRPPTGGYGPPKPSSQVTHVDNTLYIQAPPHAKPVYVPSPQPQYVSQQKSKAPSKGLSKGKAPQSSYGPPLPQKAKAPLSKAPAATYGPPKSAPTKATSPPHFVYVGHPPIHIYEQPPVYQKPAVASSQKPLSAKAPSKGFFSKAPTSQKGKQHKRPPPVGYGPPKAPTSGYGAPPKAPTSGYGAPPKAPTSGYGPPPKAPTSGYGPPPKAPTSGYGPPPKAPTYAPPPKAPTSGYGAPVKAPTSGYGAPPKAPSKGFLRPGKGQQRPSYKQRPKAPSKGYGAPSKAPQAAKASPIYSLAPKGFHKPPIIIYQGVKPPVHVYEQAPSTGYSAAPQIKAAGSNHQPLYGQPKNEDIITGDKTYSSKSGKESENIFEASYPAYRDQSLSEVVGEAPSKSSS